MCGRPCLAAAGGVGGGVQPDKEASVQSGGPQGCRGARPSLPRKGALEVMDPSALGMTLATARSCITSEGSDLVCCPPAPSTEAGVPSTSPGREGWRKEGRSIRGKHVEGGSTKHLPSSCEPPGFLLHVLRSTTSTRPSGPSPPSGLHVWKGNTVGEFTQVFRSFWFRILKRPRVW